MSTKTLPLLFLNLGGEMLYILDQRLRAQSIPKEKSQKGKQIVDVLCIISIKEASRLNLHKFRILFCLQIIYIQSICISRHFLQKWPISGCICCVILFSCLLKTNNVVYFCKYNDTMSCLNAFTLLNILLVFTITETAAFFCIIWISQSWKVL